MIKNKSLFKNLSIFFCLVPMLLLSFFCLVPKNDNFSVSALSDQVITNFDFVGSNVILPITYMNFGNNTIDRVQFSNCRLVFGVVDGSYRCSVTGVTNEPQNNAVASISGVLNNVPNLENITSINRFLRVYYGDVNYGFDCRVYHSGQLTSDIVKVVFNSYENVMVNSSRPANFYNTVTYYDSNNEYFCFEFPLYSNNNAFASNYLLEERTYYFTNSFNDNDFYNLGYQDGLDFGYQDGYQNGYQTGLDSGSQSGYQDGFSAGVQSANDYSFIGLLGAVIDAPVTALTGLLNFEILGFNILAFVTGLITLALIIFIIKLCIGGK